MQNAASDPITGAHASISALLASMELNPSAAATGAFRAAIRRNGKALLDEAGPFALVSVLQRVFEEGDDRSRARDRHRIVALAWDGLDHADGAR